MTLLQGDSLQTPLYVQNGGPHSGQQEHQKKRKKFKKLKQADIRVQAFNKLQLPVLQHQNQNGPKLSQSLTASLQGYRQPDAPPLPFQQANASMRSNGPVTMGAYPVPPFPSMQQSSPRFPPFTNVMSVPGPNKPLDNQYMNGSIGSTPFVRQPNSQTGTNIGNNFEHPPPSKMKAQTAWRKVGLASQFTAKPPFRRKSTLEIIDIDSANGKPTVFESNA